MPVQTRTKRAVRLLTIAVAIVASLFIWLIAVPVSGVELAAETGQGTQDVGAAQVVIVAALAGFAGWALLAILERRSEKPIRVWTVVALVVLALSLLGPLGAETAGAALTLVALHVATGAALIGGFRLSATTHASTRS